MHIYENMRLIVIFKDFNRYFVVFFNNAVDRVLIVYVSVMDDFTKAGGFVNL